MVHSVVPVSCLDQDVPSPSLPPFTDTLNWAQRHPLVLVVAGITFTVVSGVVGLVAGLGGVQ